ncbi:hypothetical protein CCYA_CCYA01G0031 [Cyanidiococcus yangmingshanensis]|nr:hypothetical protein CCYA_CCYA01G0031 [Cyanidiococcus yangmingshanensis]
MEAANSTPSFLDTNVSAQLFVNWRRDRVANWVPRARHKLGASRDGATAAFGTSPSVWGQCYRFAGHVCSYQAHYRRKVASTRRLCVFAESDYTYDNESFDERGSQTANVSQPGAGTARGFGAFTRDWTREADTGRGRRQGQIRVLSDSRTFRFYEYLREAHFPKVTLAEVQSPGHSQSGMRGLFATAPIRSGETVCRIPRRLAICLGNEGENPGLPALYLLRMMTDGETVRKFQAYFDVLPRPEVCKVTTDFFTQDELSQMIHEPTAAETRRRRELLRETFLREFLRINPGEPGAGTATNDLENMPEFQRYLWAVYLVVSRALAVRTGNEAQRYLIPLLDMMNCQMDSKHELRYRIATDEFVLIAGEPIRRSEEIRIAYGGGFVSNDRLLQDYGFVVDQNPADLQLFLPQDGVQRPDLLSATHREQVRERCEAVLARETEALSVPSDRVRAFNRAIVGAARKCLELLDAAERIQS